MENCILCKIAAGEIPAYKVYEDDGNLAILDIAPINQGHVLVFTKKHHKNIEDTPEDELAFLIKAVKKVGKLIKDGLGAEGYNVFENNDPAAGQIIPHTHFHVIPRKTGDGFEAWKQGKYAEGEAEKVLGQMKSAI